ncbi:MAG: GNAT family protein [Candidatus Binataceae bacterium]
MDGRLVRLRAYEKSDLDAVMKWVNDEEVKHFLGSGPLTYPVSRIQEEQFIEMANRPADDRKTFAIETLQGEYIGGIDLHAIDWISRHAEIGIVIGDKHLWGKGYGSDAMRVLLRLVFDKMGLHRVWLRVYSFNERAIASYERCGFKREGVLREQHLADGRYHDVIVMGLLEPEYRAALAPANP